MLNKLKFVALPKSEESPKSLLIRTAFANGFRSVAHMARSLIPTTANAQPLSWQLEHAELVQVIAAEAGEYRDSFLSGFYTQLSRVTTDSPVIFSGVTTPLTKLRRTKYAFCPECAREGWQRFGQDLSILEACPHHQCEFVHQCPSCEAPLAWHHLDGNKCKCGFDLASIEGVRCTAHGSETVMRAYLSQDQEAVARLHASVKALRVDDECTIQARQEKLHIAGLIALTDKAALKGAIRSARLLHPRLPQSMILAPWAAISDEWIKEVVAEIELHWKMDTLASTEPIPAPDIYFYRDEIRAALRVSASKISALVKSGLIFRSKRQGKLSWIYRSPDWLGVVNQSQAIAAGNGQNENLTHFDIRTAAQALNSYPEAVRRAVKAGVIPILQNQGGGIRISAESIHGFKEENIFIGELAISLGASNTTLRARLKAVGITPFSGPGIDDGLVSIYRRSDLDHDKIQKSLTLKTYPYNAGRKTTDPTTRKKNIINSTEASAHLGIAMQRLQHFQKFGLLVQVLRSDLSADYRRYFTEESVLQTKAWLDNSVTMEHATSETNLSPQALIRRFVKTGFIKVIKIGKLIILSKSDLSKIKQHASIYCSCDQADRFLGAPNGHASNLISTQRLKVAPSSETGISTLRLIRWNDVKALLK